MRDYSEISHFPLKVIFAVHFLLVTFSMGGWPATSVVFYNVLFFICIFWAISNTESDEPIQFALFLSVASEFFDFINLTVHSPFGGSAFAKFSGAIVIVNMVVRVFTTLYLLRLGQARGGTLATIIPSSAAMGSLGRQDYEDISHPVPQNSDFAAI